MLPTSSGSTRNSVRSSRSARLIELPASHVTGEFDYLLKVRCVGTRELEQLINDELKLESGVASSRTVVPPRGLTAAPSIRR